VETHQIHNLPYKSILVRLKVHSCSENVMAFKSEQRAKSMAMPRYIEEKSDFHYNVVMLE
jgi:hypothetical protein